MRTEAYDEENRLEVCQFLILNGADLNALKEVCKLVFNSKETEGD